MASNSKGDNAMAKNISSISPISYGDPCHDLCFHVKSPDNVVGLCLPPPEPSDEEREQQNKATLNYLKQLLPVAWSHNSLTTLKLIFNLNSQDCPAEKYFRAAFYEAAFWLHHNHPKTLLCNIPSIAGSGSGSFYVSIARLWELVEILYGLLLEQGEDSAAQRLHCDAHYKLLHDRVMEVLAEQLKSDIDKLKQHKLGMELESGDNDKEDGTTLLPVSQAAEYCTPISPEQVQATRTSNSYSQGVDFDQVCDLILEVAMNNNLKAEQMIKKVFVFTDSIRFGGCSTSWKTV